MSILSEYRIKIGALRKVRDEIKEFVEADDVPIKVRSTVMTKMFHESIQPKLAQLHITMESYDTGGDEQQFIRSFMNALNDAIGYDPVDTSAGHN